MMKNNSFLESMKVEDTNPGVVALQEIAKTLEKQASVDIARSLILEEINDNLKRLILAVGGNGVE